MTNGEKHIEKLLSWYKEAVTEDGVCYLTSDDKNTLAYAIKCCKHFEDIKKDIDSWVLREKPSSSENPNKSEISTDSTTKNGIDREELLKAMDTWDKFGYDPNERLIPLRTPALQDRYVPYVKYDDMVNCVKGMPSVTPQEPRWIPCSEKLPENKETVLVTFKHFVSGNTIGLGSMILLRGKPHWHVREQNLGTYDVLTWMPLPKAYSEVTE